MDMSNVTEMLDKKDEEIEQLKKEKDFLVKKYVCLVYKQTEETVRRCRERILEEIQQALKEE